MLLKLRQWHATYTLECFYGSLLIIKGTHIQNLFKNGQGITKKIRIPTDKRYEHCKYDFWSIKFKSLSIKCYERVTIVNGVN